MSVYRAPAKLAFLARRGASIQEVEIKFRIADITALARALRQAGFRLVTRRTHEMNTLYDLPGNPLRRRGELLRIRQYGRQWTVTFKAKAAPGRHKSRTETETQVGDGRTLARILESADFRPVFTYEKFRSQWSDGRGLVVVDETPIGNFGEIEGRPRWIDAVARRLKIAPRDYITDSYAGLFFQWKKAHASAAQDMTFDAVRQTPR